MKMLRRTFVGLSLGFLAASCTTSTGPQLDSHVVYLVRHAEKAEGRDPALTDAGQRRAERLATMLSDAGLTQIWSTDTRRTRQTAAPMAEMAGLEISIYDPRKPEEFTAMLKATPGRYLVVGHSNTVPALVDLLADDPDPTPIIEDTEYDRLYTIRFMGDRTDTMMERF